MSTSPGKGRDRDTPVSVFPLARRPWTGSVPSPLTPLIGRDGERPSARMHVEHDARLLTLTGPDGIGKSRLAVQLAVDLESRFPDGVAWVSLVSLVSMRDIDALPPSIAKVLGSGNSLAPRRSEP